MNRKIGFGSLCVHEAKEKRTTPPHILPVYATSSFEFQSLDQGINSFLGKEDNHMYSRYGNPTVDAVAEKIAKMEAHQLGIEASAYLFSSGMSAISTLTMSLLQSGDKLLTQSNLYGGTSVFFTKILHTFGVETIMTNLKDLDHVEEILRQDPKIKMIYLETPANPTMSIVDIQAICDLAHRYDCHTAIDNTFCTPYLQQPFAFGIDFIVHSATKFLNGHGNSIAGLVVGRDLELMKEKVWTTMKLNGTNCSPWEAWLLYNGLKTLEVRMDRHCANAQKVAEFLEKHPKVLEVNYNGLPSHPDHQLAKRQMKGFGGMLSFELKGGLEAGKQFIDHLELCSMAPTLGDVDTLVLHPASMSHVNIPRDVREQNGITDGLIRLSVGIETVEDILEDLERALGEV